MFSAAVQCSCALPLFFWFFTNAIIATIAATSAAAIPIALLVAATATVSRCISDPCESLQVFKVPQEYERKWSEVSIEKGVMKITFKPDADEEGLPVH